MNPPVIRRSLTTLVVVGALAVSAGCAGSNAATGVDPVVAAGGDTAVAAAVGVRVDQMAFEPASLTVVTGTTVTWVWDTPIAHDVVGDGFRSEILTAGTYSHTFEEVGVYRYICSLHPSMTGTIEVTP